MPVLGFPHFKSFHRFPTILAIGLPIPLHQELPSAMPHPIVKNRLNLPFFLVINQDRCRFGVGLSRELLIIVKVVGFDN